MAELLGVIFLLSNGRQRATFGAVASLLRIGTGRALTSHIGKLSRRPNNSWIVNTKGVPPGYTSEQMAGGLLQAPFTSDPAELQQWLRQQLGQLPETMTLQERRTLEPIRALLENE